MPTIEEKSQQSNEKTNLKSRLQIRRLLFLVGVSCIVLGVNHYYQIHRKTSGIVQPPAASDVVTTDTADPIEQKVDEEAYEVPADQPRRIISPNLSLSGIIQRVGLTNSGAVAAPYNVHVAGWYIGSVKPSEQGLSIIDGHLSGKYTDGIFKQLRNLQKNEEIQIEFGNRSIKKFSVVDVINVAEDQASEVLFRKYEQIDKQLNLITCSGAFNRQTNSFDDRTIVVTKAID